MTLNQWDDNILILELLNEPDFSEDTDSLILKLQSENETFPNVIIDLQNVSTLNSSNLGALIEIKKLLETKDKRMVICNISDSIWSTMLATGLDQVFEFIEDTTTALLLIGS
ncbi:MAG TPA: anti-sigma factor antagonist [Phycisphaerales bacterium]|nr:anti-sigma factor antagonist [Phycisphaerales bacterium]HIB49930.1 anti-sigma factor antagonist [Phycisphaerales bacterium]HIN83977.1 anti-sigma factor antagonist [Phycisphaerales bacterium]HIO20571.1 anti-sigma factor antagonist [Phycisphaerales bacterium]